MRPIHLVTKKGTLVDCSDHCLVSESPAIIGGLTIESVLATLSEALPHRAIATYSRLSNPVLVGKDNSKDGVYVFSSFGATGCAGAVYGYDGYQSACNMGTLGVVGKSDAEDEMARYPWEIVRCEFNTETHGAGRWRGCQGIVWEAINNGSDAFNMGGPMDGFFTQGLGRAGGAPTPKNQLFVIRNGEKLAVKEPRGRTLIRHGDHFLVMSGGGAGVGNPWERDPEAVLKDVLNELISVEVAKEVYKVAIDPVKLEINRKETEELRGLNIA
jgi:N-methylhydantoinase B